MKNEKQENLILKEKIINYSDQYKEYIGVSAMYSLFISAFCILIYTFIMSYGGMYYREPLFNSIFAFSTSGIDEWILISLILRFIVVFGFLWLPITALLAKKNNQEND